MDNSIFFLPKLLLSDRAKRLILALISLLTLILSACYREKGEIKVEIDEPAPVVDFNRLRAMEIASSLDDRCLVSQLFISGIEGNGSLSEKMNDLLKNIPAGGIMLFGYNLKSDSETVRSYMTDIITLIVDESGIPPFISTDHEGGRVNRFINGIGEMPWASSYIETALKEGSKPVLQKIQEDSKKAGMEIYSLGINMNLAPIAEYLIPENIDFLRRRSYGSDPVFTAQASVAFIKGMKEAGIICVVKHFPGTAGNDPHYSASVLNMDKNHLNLLIAPFVAAINNGARAIMASHTVVPAIDSKVASLSSVVMRDWLRKEIGFEGLIISDDFTMAAAGDLKPEESSVLSIAAGSDMVLVWPMYLKKTYDAFIAALEDGTLTRERLIDSVQRVIYEKLLLGLPMNWDTETAD